MIKPKQHLPNNDKSHRIEVILEENFKMKREQRFLILSKHVEDEIGGGLLPHATTHYESVSATPIHRPSSSSIDYMVCVDGSAAAVTTQPQLPTDLPRQANHHFYFMRAINVVFVINIII
jgi:hypothetical protein